MLLRFFNKATSFGPKSTAMKILYGIVDDQKSGNHIGPYGCKYHTDNIHSLKFLVDVLARSIKSVIDYDLYKKLTKEEKNQIKSLLISTLSEATKNYETKYYNEMEVHKGDEIIKATDYANLNSHEFKYFTEKYGDYCCTTTGLATSILLGDTDVNVDDTPAHLIWFPKELFGNQDLLQGYIFSALYEKYSHLLVSNMNVELSEAGKFRNLQVS